MFTQEDNERLHGNVFAELKDYTQFIGYVIETRDGKVTKVPRLVDNSGHASSTNPATWTTFEQSTVGALSSGLNGIGFVFTKDDPFCGIDFDHCLDLQTGQCISVWVAEQVRVLNSYTEISQSGTGLHVIIKANLPDGGRKSAGVEMYDSGRYFAMTGKHWPSAPKTINPRQDEVMALHRQVFAERAEPTQPKRKAAPSPSLSDSDLLDKAFSAKNGDLFKRLWHGDDTGYPSQSEADQAWANIASFWLDGDALRMDGWYHQSGRARAKWDESHYADGTTYGQMTIQKAISGTAQGYSANGTGPHTNGVQPAVRDENHTDALTSGSIAEKHHLTELGNARRLVVQHGDDLRYCHTWARWVTWDGTRWLQDDTGAATRLAKSTVATIYREASRSQDADERKAIGKWALASESSRRIDAMLHLARSEDTIAVTHTGFDARPLLLNVQNGTIDLTTGRLRSHDRDDLITRMAPVKYDASATCPVWDAYLWRIMAGNPNLIGFLRRAIGYALTDSVQEQCFFILYGTGQNGKSTFLETLAALLGDYRVHTPTSTLMAKQGDAIPNDVARLKGARLVTAIEADEGRRLAEGLVKSMTGGDTMTARYLRAEYFEFKPTFKLFLATNHKPVIRGTDRAIWRRIRLIPFAVTIADDEKDGDLPDKLKAELSGILNWAIQGCLDWLESGLGLPDEVRAATEEYKAEMDVLSSFIAQCCTLHLQARVRASELYAAYDAWAKENNEYLMSSTQFGRRLAERGFEKKRDGSGMVYFGLGLGEDAPRQRVQSTVRRGDDF